MAVLDRDGFFNGIQEIVGTDTSEKTLAFIENMTDTYNDMEKRADGSDIDWEKKYHELDESWKTKYRQRFFSSNGNSHIPEGNNENGVNSEPDADNIKIDDLFKPA